MTPVEKEKASGAYAAGSYIPTLVIQTLTLSICSTMIFPLCFSVLPVESLEIIYKELQIGPETKTQCKNSHSHKFNFKHNQFCPNLIFKTKFDDEFIENPIQEHPFVQIVNSEGENEQILQTQSHNHKYNQQELISGDTICRFFDKNIKLLAARMTSLPWNFTKTRQCRHVSNKFPENHNVPCEMNGESNISMSLRVDSEGLTALSNENSSRYCLTGTKFLIAIFRKRKGAACMVKVQQYKIDLNMTKEKCEDYENMPTCGLYACSDEESVLSHLDELSGHSPRRPSISTDEFSKPWSDFQFQKPSYSDTMKKKSTIKDYFIELLVLLFLALLFIICLFNKCCRISETTEARNQPITMVSDSRRNSETGLWNTYPYRKHKFMDINSTITPSSRCSAKAACVCTGSRGRKKAKTKKWGHRGCDDEAYTPVRQDDTAPYIPSVARV